MGDFCRLPTRRPYAGVCFWRGVCSRGWVSGLGGVCVCSQGVCSGGCLLPGFWSGGCLLLGGVWSGGVCSQGSGQGGCAPRGCLVWGVSAPGGLVRGVSAHGGCLLLDGVCSGGSGPGAVSQHALRKTPYSPPLWTEFLTHACENITLAQLRCGR